MSENQVIQETIQTPTQPISQGGAQPPAAPQEKTDQAAVESVKDAAKNDDPDFSRKFAALSKKQQALFLREQELKAREDKYSEIDKLEALREQNPLEYLSKKGLKLDSILQQALKQGEEPTVEDKLKNIDARIDNYLKQQEEKEKRSADDAKAAQSQREQEAIDNFKKKIETDIKGDLDKYEVINAQGAFDTVFEVIQEQFEKTGKVMAITDAADLVEEYLLQDIKKLLTLKKLGIKPETKDPQQTTAEAVLNQDAVSTSAASPTLKSTVTPSSTPSSDENLSFHERMEKAKAMLRSSGMR